VVGDQAVERQHAVLDQRLHGQQVGALPFGGGADLRSRMKAGAKEKDTRSL
jgi:hypothetical protein